MKFKIYESQTKVVTFIDDTESAEFASDLPKEKHIVELSADEKVNKQK